MTPPEIIVQYLEGDRILVFRSKISDPKYIRALLQLQIDKNRQTRPPLMTVKNIRIPKVAIRKQKKISKKSDFIPRRRFQKNFEATFIVMNDLFQFEALKLVRNVLKVQQGSLQFWKFSMSIIIFQIQMSLTKCKTVNVRLQL